MAPSPVFTKMNRTHNALYKSQMRCRRVLHEGARLSVLESMIRLMQPHFPPRNDEFLVKVFVCNCRRRLNFKDNIKNEPQLLNYRLLIAINLDYDGMLVFLFLLLLSLTHAGERPNPLYN